MHPRQRVVVSLHYWYGFSGALALRAARHWHMLTDFSGSSPSAPPSTAPSRSCVSLLLCSVAQVSGTTQHRLPETLSLMAVAD
jgi:hypothetical protein